MIRRAAMILAALLLGCSSDEDTTVSLEGILGAPVDLALAKGPTGDRLFVANGDGGDVKVLELEGKLRWVPAPNKLAALSIVGPERPRALAAARGVNGAGQRLDAVFVIGAGKKVWAVDAGAAVPKASLELALELGTLSIVAAPEETAGPPLAFVGLSGRAENGILPVFFDGGERPVGGTVLPLSGVPGSLAVSVEEDGTTEIFAGDASSDGVMVLPLGGTERRVAVGGPVIDVAVSPPFTDPTTGETRRWLFAALAGGGIRPVEIHGAGERVPADPTNPAQPWPLIEVGGVVQGMTFVSGAQIRVGGTAQTVPLAMAVSSSDGAIYWIEVVPKPRVLDADANATPSIDPPVLLDPTLVAGPAPTLREVKLSLGVSRTERWSLTFEGRIPGFTDRPAQVESSSDGTLVLTDATLGPAGFGSLPDELRVILLAAPCPGMSGLLEYEKTSITGNRIVASPLPGFSPAPTCKAVVPYALRPKGEWVVAGTVTGFAGTFKDAVGEPFEYVGRRFWVPDNPTTDPAPSLGFKFTPGGAASREATLSFNVNAGVAPAFVGVDRDARDLQDPFEFASGLAFRPGGPPQVYAAMSGGDAVLAFDPAEGDTNISLLR